MKQVSLSGHLFDKFLINEALDIIEAAGGSFQLVRCEVGQSIDDTSYSELEVGADDTATLDKIVDSLTSLANAHGGDHDARKETELALKIGKVNECGTGDTVDKEGPKVLILGAGRVCRPAAQFLASYPNICSYGVDDNNTDQIHVIVASLYQKDAEEVILATMHSPTLDNFFPVLFGWLHGLLLTCSMDINKHCQIKNTVFWSVRKNVYVETVNQD
jgi:alpha-aminoadipic semialdehyde synthase